MWLQVTAIGGGTVQGILENEARRVKNLKCGDRVTLRVADLNDWMYAKEKPVPVPKGSRKPFVGGFTTKGLLEAQNGR